MNLFLADRDNERDACSAPADTQKPAENIVCSAVEQKAAEAPTAVPSGSAKRDSALKSSSSPTSKGVQAKAALSTVPAGSQSKHKSGASTEGEDLKASVVEQKAEASAAKSSKEDSASFWLPVIEFKFLEQSNICCKTHAMTGMFLGALLVVYRPGDGKKNLCLHGC